MGESTPGWLHAFRVQWHLYVHCPGVRELQWTRRCRIPLSSGTSGSIALADTGSNGPRGACSAPRCS